MPVSVYNESLGSLVAYKRKAWNMKRLEGSGSDIYALTSLHGCVCSGGHDKVVYVHKLDAVCRMRGHMHSIKALAAMEDHNNQDASRIVSGSWDMTVIGIT